MYLDRHVSIITSMHHGIMSSIIITWNRPGTSIPRAQSCGPIVSRGAEARQVVAPGRHGVIRSFRTSTDRSARGTSKPRWGARPLFRDQSRVHRQRDGLVAILVEVLSRAGQRGHILLPPGWVAVEQAKGVLGLLVVGHLVFELAALLVEGAYALMNPFVAVDLFALGLVERLGSGHGRRIRRNDGVNATLRVQMSEVSCELLSVIMMMML